LRYERGVPTPLDHCQGLPERTFEPGEILIREGVSAPLFILAEGAVEILKADLRIRLIDEPGSVFGEISALLGIQPTATVRALERTRTFVAEDGVTFLSSRPELTLLIARILAQRVNAVTTYLADIKRQFEDQKGRLGIVDEVLETLVNDPSTGERITRGSDREPDPNL
jgi:CRP/FNR family transcriptional regulator, cyclic AMP receptor protein